MKSDPIFKRDSTGGLRTWCYEVEGSQWRTIAGGPGRKDVVSGWVTCKGKQGRTDEQQALSEAVGAETSKLLSEYRRTEQELDTVPRSPMLAHKFDDHKENITFPVYSQPKLDGIRALISRHGAFSRDYRPHLNVDHILAALAPIFAEYPDVVFDGELYNHEFKDNFGKISSIVRKQSPTDAQRAEAAKYLQFHCYDIADDQRSLADRLYLIDTLALTLMRPGSPIRWVDTSEVINAGELDQYYGEYLEAGYEGQMIRLNTPYEFDKRSKSLLKRKEFLTDEFKLLRIEEGQGNWAGHAKRVVFALPDGRECGAGVRGTQAEMKKLLGEAVTDQSQVTIRYFTPTPDGVPRFPVAVDLHINGRRD